MKGPAQDDQRSVEAILASLGEAAAYARAGGVGEEKAPLLLRDALTAARRAGEPVAASLGVLRRLLRRAADLEKARLRLTRLYRARLAFAVAMAAAARAGLAAFGVASSERGLPLLFDVSAVLLGATIAAAVDVMFARSLPRSWLLRSGLTPSAVTWFRCHVLREPPASLSCFSVWDALRSRELALGVDLRADRRQVLETWAEDCSLADDEALRRAEDRLPLAELLGLGVPLLLALLAPALEALAHAR